jgi:Asp-tRNA(Asn)/Glu-tRNA(Gln) amidotransferase A subunit family amidase
MPCSAGALTCTKLTQLYLNRIAAYNNAGPGLNAVVVVNRRTEERIGGRRAVKPRHCPRLTVWRASVDQGLI